MGTSLGTQRGRVEAGDSREVPAWTQLAAGEGVSVAPTQLPLWVCDYSQPYISHARSCAHGQASALNYSLIGPPPAGPLCSDALGTTQNNRCTTELFITPRQLPLQLSSSRSMATFPSSCPDLNPQSPSQTPPDLSHLMPGPSVISPEHSQTSARIALPLVHTRFP